MRGEADGDSYGRMGRGLTSGPSALRQTRTPYRVFSRSLRLTALGRALRAKESG